MGDDQARADHGERQSSFSPQGSTARQRPSASRSQRSGSPFTVGAGAVQGLVVSVPMLLRKQPVANADLHELHGDDPELGEDDPDSVLRQRVPFGPFLALAAMEFVLLRRVIEEAAAWWAGGGAF